MPKLLVLFQSRSLDVERLAETVAEGARGVRFAEVDVRRLPASGDGREAAPDASRRAHHLLQQADDVAQYDGLIVALEHGETETVARALDAAGSSLANKVGAAITTATGDDRRTLLWSALSPMADRGMILVPAPFADEGAANPESTRGLGKRVAEVIGWVTHARGHDHAHDHGHRHGREHGHHQH